MVGAVLVIKDRIVARGHHRQAGQRHAEMECLENFGRPLPKEAVLYVTLEPCSTTQRTPPCTAQLVQSGIKTIVVGAVDVNPHHAGRGLEILRQAGLIVRSGVLAEECAALNEAFNKWIQTRRPLVIAKCAMTLDGRLTRLPAQGRWITSATARRHANRLRAQVDAILIGAETLRVDNPRLTVRAMPGARQPWRVVLSRSGRLPRAARVFTDREARRTLVFRDRPLTSVIEALGEKEITSVMIEGGGDILGQALDARLIDKVHIYLAPFLGAGPVFAFPGRGVAASAEGLRLGEAHYEKIGPEIFISGKADYGPASPE